MTERQKKELACAFVCLIPAAVVGISCGVSGDEQVSPLALPVGVTIFAIAYGICVVAIAEEGRKPKKLQKPRRSYWYFFLNRIAELSCAVRGKRVEEDKPKDSKTDPD